MGWIARIFGPQLRPQRACPLEQAFGKLGILAAPVVEIRCTVAGFGERSAIGDIPRNRFDNLLKQRECDFKAFLPCVKISQLSGEFRNLK